MSNIYTTILIDFTSFIAAVPCIKQYLGLQFTDQPFLEEGDVLSGGEYFGGRYQSNEEYLLSFL